MRRLASAVAVVLLATGCQSGAPESRADVLARAQRLAPADQKLAALYAQSCKACHTRRRLGRADRG